MDGGRRRTWLARVEEVGPGRSAEAEDGRCCSSARRASARRTGPSGSTICWCSDGFEFTCWNGDVVRGAFIIDAHDREIISWRAVANAGISGSDICDMTLEAAEQRFGAYRTQHPVEMLSDNGSCYVASETRIFTRQLGLRPCYTPVKSSQSN